MYCKICKRNIVKGGKLKNITEMTPKERITSLAATMRWYKKFLKVHRQLVKEGK